MIFLVEVSGLSLLQWFDTIGCMTEKVPISFMMSAVYIVFTYLPT